jgi:hypothetical protein
MDDNFYMDEFYTGEFNKETLLLVKKLTVKCPWEEPLPSCPLNALREMPLPEKLIAVDKMSAEELDNIASHHEICLQKREKQQ